MDDAWKCRKCGKALETRKVVFDYLGSRFQYDLPCCPDCGAPYVSAALAEGKVAEVELMLEDK